MKFIILLLATLLPFTTNGAAMTTKIQTAYLAGGCFWGMAELVRQIPGVLETEVGYTGGSTPNGHGNFSATDNKTEHARSPHPNPLPQAVEGTNESLRAFHFNATYEQVKTGRTGHAESLKVVFDPSILTYRHLLFEFFRMHNPTTRDKQGNDIGTQYRSAIFYLNEEQHRTALDVIKTVDASGDWHANGHDHARFPLPRPLEEQLANRLSPQAGKSLVIPLAGEGDKDSLREIDDHVVTEVMPFREFFRAEEYHQQYLVKHPAGYTCHYIRRYNLGE